MTGRRYVQPIAVFGLPGSRARTDHQAKVEELIMKLVAASGSGLPAAMDEVKRREEVFAAARKATVRATPPPDVAALESVLDDVFNGRL